MKKLVLGLTACVALVGSTCLLSGCNKNDKALAKVTAEWNEIKKNSYVGEDGILDSTAIHDTKGVAYYYSTFGDYKDYNYSRPIQSYFLKNVMTPLASIDNLNKSSFKQNLTNKNLKKLASQLEDLNIALTNYTTYVDGMNKTILGGSTLLYGDLLQYKSLASIVISEAFEASDIYLDMIYNNALNCNIAKNAVEVNSEVANTITQKLGNEIAHSFHNIYYNLTDFDALSIAKATFSLNDYDNFVITNYTEKVTSLDTIKKLSNMQSQIATAEKANEMTAVIAEEFDFDNFRLNFETYYPKDASYVQKNDSGVALQEECIKKYSSEKEYSMFLTLSNLISVDLTLAFNSLK